MQLDVDDMYRDIALLAHQIDAALRQTDAATALKFMFLGLCCDSWAADVLEKRAIPDDDKRSSVVLHHPPSQAPDDPVDALHCHLRDLHFSLEVVAVLLRPGVERDATAKLLELVRCMCRQRGVELE
ncbi:uncharacterized protein LOC117650964 [Thrips palmi]|uniref:Uncharacterized protein LOC117650964 n=1 Tax=Thrips palmi TaxID=161013 RepID=A0A6P9A0T2_THRPL|nr:uncharacterized protein LOC117650964 [Thrips palmi]